MNVSTQYSDSNMGHAFSREEMNYGGTNTCHLHGNIWCI